MKQKIRKKEGKGGYHIMLLCEFKDIGQDTNFANMVLMKR